jgi:hypothetical protein
MNQPTTGILQRQASGKHLPPRTATYDASDGQDLSVSRGLTTCGDVR